MYVQYSPCACPTEQSGGSHHKSAASRSNHPLKISARGLFAKFRFTIFPKMFYWSIAVKRPYLMLLSSNLISFRDLNSLQF